MSAFFLPTTIQSRLQYKESQRIFNEEVKQKQIHPPTAFVINGKPHFKNPRSTPMALYNDEGNNDGSTLFMGQRYETDSKYFAIIKSTPGGLQSGLLSVYVYNTPCCKK